MAGGTIQLKGHQAKELYEFLGTATKVSANDKRLLGEMRRSLAKLLGTNDEGRYSELDPKSREMIYTIQDLHVHKLSPDLIGKPIRAGDGEPVLLWKYDPKKLEGELGQWSFTAEQKAPMFRLFLDRFEKAEGGAEGEYLLRLMSWIPTMCEAVALSLSTLYKEAEFEEQPPESTAGGKKR